MPTPSSELYDRLQSDPRLQEIKGRGYQLMVERLHTQRKKRLQEIADELAELKSQESKIKDEILGARPTVQRLNITLSPLALDAIAGLKYALELTRHQVSTSALIEAALLHLEEQCNPNARLLLDTIEKYVGTENSRRRSAPE